MIQDPVKRSRLKRTLIIVIVAAISCYGLGLVVLLVNGAVRSRVTATPTIQLPTEFILESATWTPTLPLPTAIFPTGTVTATPTITLTPTRTRTYVVPTSTPSITPTATDTPPPPTETGTAVSEFPSDTPTTPAP